MRQPDPQRDGADDADEHLRERLVTGEEVFSGNFLRVRRDTVSLPGGLQSSREYITHSGAVVVVPMLDDGRLVLERQYRYPLQQVLLEFPAGKIDPGEDTLFTGARELAEETGYTAAEWARACRLHNAAAYSTEFIEVWFARGLTLGAQQLDHGELLEVTLMTEGELDALAASGHLTDAKTLIGLLWLQKWRAGLWPLQWRGPPERP